MEKCKGCGRDWDSANEFCEYVELLQALERYINIEDYCPECLERIDDEIMTSIDILKSEMAYELEMGRPRE